jgi:hypothetical protein
MPLPDTHAYTAVHMEKWRELMAEIPPQQYSACDIRWFLDPVDILTFHYLSTCEKPDPKVLSKMADEILYNTVQYAASLIVPRYVFDRTERDPEVTERLHASAEPFFVRIEDFVRAHYPEALHIEITRWAIERPIGNLVDLATLEKWGTERLTDKLEEVTERLIEALPKIFTDEVFGKDSQS